MKETREYSQMLYALADEIRDQEGCVTESAESVEEAAERLDAQTVTIKALIGALDNCRMLASQNRKKDWAVTILRFCSDGGSKASPLRAGITS